MKILMNFNKHAVQLVYYRTIIILFPIFLYTLDNMQRDRNDQSLIFFSIE